jgi:acyl carrier protein phosphodiesterase
MYAVSLPEHDIEMRHALAPFPPSNPRKQLRRKASRVRSLQSKHPHRATTVEIATRLSVNVVIGVAAIASLVRLVPYNMAQHSKLKSLNAEVQNLEQQVDVLQSDFVRYFDPQQTQSVMQQESSRVTEGQRRVVWTESSGDRTSPSMP